MKIKKVQLVTEASKVGNVQFINTTEDQFPYIEAAISSLDNNLNWWKSNWENMENTLMNAYTKVSSSPTKIRTRFTIYNGSDDVAKDIKWTGPAIEYTFVNANSGDIQEMKKHIGNILEGHKVIFKDNTVTILFG